ncbi:MAG TPA: MFS transporter [Acetobacteraceae bacterium]|nr:MFS transporter [Acetobacteraceae bacterium]
MAILAAIALARLGFGYQFQTVGSLGPTLIPLFGMDYTTFGQLIGAFMLVGTFAALPLGLAGGRFGDRMILAGGLALMVAGAVVSALGGEGAPGRALGSIALGRALCGVGGVAMVVIQGKVLADWFQGRGFLLAISVSVSAYPIGIGLAQLTQPPLAEVFGWPAAFLAGGAIQAAALALFLASFQAPPHGSAHQRRVVLPSGRECLLTALAGLVWAAYTSGYTGFLSYAPSLMAARGESAALTGVVIAIASWGNVPPTLFGAGLANRYGAFRIVLIGTGAVVLGIAGSALTDWPIVCALLLGVIGQIHPGVIQAIGTLSARVETRAAGMGIFYGVYYAAGTVVPALCGAVADWTDGPEGALLCAAAVSALAMPAYMLHRRLVSHATMLARA